MIKKQKTFIIKSTVEIDDETGFSLYWNNLEGWTDRDQATGFSDSDVEFMSLPSQSVWIDKQTGETIDE